MYSMVNIVKNNVIYLKFARIVDIRLGILTTIKAGRKVTIDVTDTLISATHFTVIKTSCCAI